MMSTVELLHCLTELGLNVMDTDLTKPTAQSTQAIYAGFLDVFTSAQMELLEQPKNALLNMMEYRVGASCSH